MSRLTLLVAAAASALPAAASAHFPFLEVKSQDGPAVVHVYFGETAEPDDPSLLPRLEDAKLWQVRPAGEPTPLTLRLDEKSLTAEAASTGPAAFVLKKEYGVVSRKGEAFLLQYYAKAFTGSDALATDTSALLPLDVAPALDGNALTLTTTWKGQPIAGAEVVVSGGVEHHEGTTDAAGRFSCALADPGLYSIRVRHVEAAPGERDGKPYATARHYATVTLRRP